MKDSTPIRGTLTRAATGLPRSGDTQTVEALEYIIEVSTGLVRRANAQELPLLSYLLEMAVLQAANELTAQKHKAD